MKGLLLILAMLAGSQNPPAANAPRGDAQNGKTLFMKYGCYECHGREGQGSNATGIRDLLPIFGSPRARCRRIRRRSSTTNRLPIFTRFFSRCQSPRRWTAFRC
ncbi:MAG: hypothetical protein DMG19_15190 [Acidobacteria bacterium]|nr:MAG: hypothetical protein DMG19_15190 [Acidobacteriota bacterium]